MHGGSHRVRAAILCCTVKYHLLGTQCWGQGNVQRLSDLFVKNKSSVSFWGSGTDSYCLPEMQMCSAGRAAAKAPITTLLHC